jgi:ABC-type transporter Mla subunit MlaD
VLDTTRPPPRWSSTRSTSRSTTSRWRSARRGQQRGSAQRPAHHHREELRRQGANFNKTIRNLGRFTGTLENNKEELFGSAAELERFVGALARNDKTVRTFNKSIAGVSDLLSDERQELALSLKNLGTALGEVQTFVKDNKTLLSKNIKGLNRVSQTLVKRAGSSTRSSTSRRWRSTTCPDLQPAGRNAGHGGQHRQPDRPDRLRPGRVPVHGGRSDRPVGGACDVIKTIFPRAGPSVRAAPSTRRSPS